MTQRRLLVLLLLAAPLAAQNGVNFPPVPTGPYEPVTTAAQILETPTERAAGLNLLNQASQNYTFGQQGRPDTALQVTLQSSGQAAVEGSGFMTDLWSGPRSTWSAEFANTTSGKSYGIASNPVPLRVVMARQALLWPIGRIPALKQIRVANVTLGGQPATCILVTEAAVVAPSAGRGWREAEYCMNAAGLLELMSPAPGLAYVYDYSSPLRFAGHIAASSVTAYVGSSAILHVQITQLGPPTPEQQAALAAAPPHPGILSGPIAYNFHPETNSPAYQVDRLAVVHATLAPNGHILDSELLAGDPSLLPEALMRIGRLRFRPLTVEHDVYARIEAAGGE